MKRKLLAPLGIAGLLVAAPAAAGADQGLPGYSAVATARGGYAEYGIRGFLLVEKYLDGSGPTAQAALDSLGTSRSFASLPYPGDTFVKYPGLVAVVTGQVPPGYPLYAGADYPNTPEATVGPEDGPVSLAATAGAAGARGSARAGRDGGNEASAFLNRAEAEVTRTDSAVTATAGSVARAIAIGPLSIGAIYSKAVSRLDAGADQPVSSTELSVEGGHVGALTFTYGPGGLKLTDNGVPLPASDGLTALNGALAPAGLAVRVVAPQPVAGGQAAAVFEVASKADVPGAGPGVFRLGFGGATASITLSGTSQVTPDTITSDTGTSDPGTPPAGTPAAPASAASSPAVFAPPSIPDGARGRVDYGLVAPSPTDAVAAGPASTLETATMPKTAATQETATFAPPLPVLRQSRSLGMIRSSGRVSVLAAVVGAFGALTLIRSALVAVRSRRTM